MNNDFVINQLEHLNSLVNIILLNPNPFFWLDGKIRSGWCVGAHVQRENVEGALAMGFLDV